MTDAPSTIFFPLRTSVELFADRDAPAAITRAKLAALLYDEVIFETGLLDVTIGDSGGSHWWTPPDTLTAEQLKRSREPIPTGAPFSVAMGVQPAKGVPATEMTTMVSGQSTMAYSAQWHTGILDELAELEADWAGIITTGNTDPPASDPLGKLISKSNFRDFRDHELMADRPQFERDFIFKAFNRDSVIASDLGASFSISPLFHEIAHQREAQPDYAGDEALSVLVANIGKLPWEAVLEFREHPGSQEARDMLRSFERQAAEEDAADAYEYFRSVAQKVNRVYAQALEDQRPRLPEELAKEAVKTAVSMVPAVGPLVEKVATATQLGRGERRYRHSWTAAIMRLIRHD